MLTKQFVLGVAILLGLTSPKADAATTTLTFKSGVGISGFIELDTWSLTPRGNGTLRTDDIVRWRLTAPLASTAGFYPYCDFFFSNSCASGIFEFKNFLPLSWNLYSFRFGLDDTYEVYFSGRQSLTHVTSAIDQRSQPPYDYIAESFSINGCPWTNGCSVVPVPTALPLLATGLGALGALGVIGWRRKRKAVAAA